MLEQIGKVLATLGEDNYAHILCRLTTNICLDYLDKKVSFTDRSTTYIQGYPKVSRKINIYLILFNKMVKHEEQFVFGTTNVWRLEQ